MRLMHIVLGLGKDFFALHRQLNAQASWLSEQGIWFRRRTWNFQFGYSHQELLRLLHIQTPGSHDVLRLRAWLAKINTDAASERNMLFMFLCELNSVGLLKFINLLRSLPNVKNDWEFRYLIMPGRQDVLLEHIGHQHAFSSDMADYLPEFMKDSSALNPLRFANQISQIAGRRHVSILPGQSLTSKLEPISPNLLKAFCSWLDCPLPIEFPMPALKSQLLSREMRHMATMVQDLNNDWIDLPYAELIQTLSDIENAEPFDRRSMVSPKILNRAMALGHSDSCRLAREYLEREELYSRSEADWAGTAKKYSAWKPYSGLNERSADRLADALPDHVAEAISAKLQANLCLLNEQQKILWVALRKKQSAGGGVAFRLPRAEKAAKVTVLVQTRNHEEYIAHTLTSILKQKTDFDVDILVVDDVSTDKTRDIINDMAGRHDRIKPVFMPQKSSYGQHIEQMFRRTTSQYVAICDGDDYFTDPEKLQIQADYLDSHPDCAISFHRVHVIFEDGTHRERYHPSYNLFPGGDEIRRLEDLCGTNFIQSNSVMYRWIFTEGIPEWFKFYMLPGDWYWHILHAEIGYIHFIDRIMSAYRRTTRSLFYASEQSFLEHRSKFGIRELAVYDELLTHFGEKYSQLFTRLSNGVFADLTKHYRKTGDRSKLDSAVAIFPKLAEQFLKELQ